MDDNMGNEEDVPFDPQVLGRLDHRGRVVRILIAVLLSSAGWLWTVPYAGWAMGLILHSPAAVLFGLVARESNRPRVAAWYCLPSVLGMGASACSLSQVASMVPGVLALTFLTTLLALLLGAPQSRS